MHKTNRIIFLFFIVILVLEFFNMKKKISTKKRGEFSNMEITEARMSSKVLNLDNTSFVEFNKTETYYFLYLWQEDCIECERFDTIYNKASAIIFNRYPEVKFIRVKSSEHLVYSTFEKKKGIDPSEMEAEKEKFKQEKLKKLSKELIEAIDLDKDSAVSAKDFEFLTAEYLNPKKKK